MYNNYNNNNLRNQLVQEQFNIPVWLWIIFFITIVFLIFSKSSTCKKYIRKRSLPKCKKADYQIDAMTSVDAKQDTKVKIYNFNTSWCGWSKKFQPEWDKFSEKVKGDLVLSSKFDVRDIKCDDHSNTEMCEQYNIEGFPSVVIIDVDGSVMPYKGDRTSGALINLVSNF
jgi:hypothetical protein